MSALSVLMTAPAAVGNGGGGGSKSPVVLLIIGVFFIAVGGLQGLNPRLLWRLNKWQHKNPDAMEPSAKGFIVWRISGIAAAIVGFVIAIVAITNL